ncbi:hypothetical protein FHW58_004202 [Duganella sp. 1224]|uniref:hypothetical protein n=1 Tax=Duganella sp. 1224 TaxID=2587052 RepID=UPI0015CEB31D|nr:hypothetical protein [Duganella sp. 1224]NYE62980.1 hypothetical protein [Duganella sp. 1224]
MVNLQISIPEDLALDVEHLGLLKPETITEILREEVRKLALEHLLSIAPKLAATGDVPMSAEEIQEEIRAARSDQHAPRS